MPEHKMERLPSSLLSQMIEQGMGELRRTGPRTGKSLAYSFVKAAAHRQGVASQCISKLRSQISKGDARMIAIFLRFEI
jgi:hypothetical protein